jgi:hypothetical protein
MGKRSRTNDLERLHDAHLHEMTGQQRSKQRRAAKHVVEVQRANAQRRALERGEIAAGESKHGRERVEGEALALAAQRRVGEERDIDRLPYSEINKKIEDRHEKKNRPCEISVGQCMETERARYVLQKQWNRTQRSGTSG